MVGFTVGDDAWLPVDPRHRAMAVDVQEGDEKSVLLFSRAAIAARRENIALRKGGYQPVEAPEGVLAFERTDDRQRILCAFNLSAEPVRWPLPRKAKATILKAGLAELAGQDALFDGPGALLVEI
jgi:alpha-glucosidase